MHGFKYSIQVEVKKLRVSLQMSLIEREPEEVSTCKSVIGSFYSDIHKERQEYQRKTSLVQTKMWHKSDLI